MRAPVAADTALPAGAGAEASSAAAVGGAARRPGGTSLRAYAPPVGGREQLARQAARVAGSPARAAAAIGRPTEPVTAGGHAGTAAEDAALAGPALVAVADRDADPLDAGLEGGAVRVGAGIRHAALFDAALTDRTPGGRAAGLGSVALEVASGARGAGRVTGDIRYAGPPEAMLVGPAHDPFARVRLVAAGEALPARARVVEGAGHPGAEVLARDAGREADLVGGTGAVSAGIVLTEASDAHQPALALRVPGAGTDGDDDVRSRSSVRRRGSVEARLGALGRCSAGAEESDREDGAPNSQVTSLQQERPRQDGSFWHS